MHHVHPRMSKGYLQPLVSGDVCVLNFLRGSQWGVALTSDGYILPILTVDGKILELLTVDGYQQKISAMS